MTTDDAKTRASAGPKGDGRLGGKRAVVTGAARGIGLAIAEAFVGAGARVLLTDVLEDEGRAAAAALGDGASFCALDVRDESAWERGMGHALETLGGLDILVNNAGVTGFEGGAAAHDPEHATLEGWRAVLATNLDGVFLGCKHGLRAMRRSGVRAGSIVNIGSRSGSVGTPGASAYAASKAAVRNHTRSVALYCAEQGLPVRCNAIEPAAILTPLWEPMLGEGPEREARMAACVADCPLGRFGTTEEVASLAVHLASDESAYTTGAGFTVDGGMLAGTARVRNVTGEG